MTATDVTRVHDASKTSILWPERGVYDSPARATVDEVREMRGVVERSEAAKMVSEWAEADRESQGKRPGGRPPFLTFDGVLTLIQLMARLEASQTLRAMTSLLIYGLDDDGREELGVNIKGKSPDAVYHCVARSYHRLVDVTDPHPGPRRTKQTIQHFDELEARVDQRLRDVRHERLNAFCNAILLGTWHEVPTDIQERYKGNVAIDGTFVPAFGRHGTSRKKSNYMGIEPHAGWWARSGNHGVSDATVARMNRTEMTSLGKYRYGWETTLALACGNDPEREATFPQLVLGISMHTPGASPGKNATQAVMPMSEAGLPAGFLVGDRAYGNTPKPKDFQDPVRQMGYRLVHDMKRIDLGKTVRVAGGVLLEGNLYCPSILSNEKLVMATKHHRDPETEDERIDYEEWRKRLAERHKFLVQANGRPQANGAQRFRCPASGPTPTLKCPLRPADPAVVPLGMKPVLRQDLPLPDDRGGLCENRGGDVTVRDTEAWRREAMGLTFGTPEWAATYQTMRQSIESFNRSIKHSGLDNPDRRRVRGFASCFILTTTVIAAANMRKASRWLANPVSVDSRGRGPLKQKQGRRRDRTHGTEITRPWHIRQQLLDTSAPTNQVLRE